ncbi:MAG: hypothetical protein KC468_36350 [Myxococcales bacterium]|nr:hypothetical protein [Myxococcales bacterium]
MRKMIMIYPNREAAQQQKAVLEQLAWSVGAPQQLQEITWDARALPSGVNVAYLNRWVIEATK